MKGIAVAIAVLAVIAGIAILFTQVDLDGQDSGEFVDESGTSYTYRLAGTDKGIMQTTGISGTCTYYYVFYSQSREAYYIENTGAVTYTVSATGPFDGTPTASTVSIDNSYWTDETADRTWIKTGSLTYTFDGTEVPCEKYRAVYYENGIACTETCTVGTANNIAYEMTISYVSGGMSLTHYSCTYSLTAVGTFTPDTKMTAAAYADPGITVSGAGEYVIGDTVTLTAAGSTFGGWYGTDGKQLSADRTYSFQITQDTAVTAANNVYPDYQVDYETEGSTGLLKLDLTAALADNGITLSAGTWSAYNTDTGTKTTADLKTATFLTAGYYYVLIDGTAADGSAASLALQIFINGTVSKTYTWTYGYQTYSFSLDVLYSDYGYFVGLYSDDERRTYYYDTNSGAHDITFVNTISALDDPYLQKIASYLKTATGGMSTQERLNVLLAFVDSDAITYTSDSTAHGTDEYWQFPLETLFLKTGDCEDTSILYAAIAKQLGCETALLLFSGHMAAGVYLADYKESSPGYTYEISTDNSDLKVDGKTYYYCETTASGWKVGWVPTDVGAVEAIEVVGTA